MMRERSGWRELDSNHRSRGRPRRSRGIGSRLRRLSVGGESTGADMRPSRNLLSRGTDGSNPASSSTESGANFTQVRHGRSGFPECPVIRRHGRLILAQPFVTLPVQLYPGRRGIAAGRRPRQTFSISSIWAPSGAATQHTCRPLLTRSSRICAPFFLKFARAPA